MKKIYLLVLSISFLLFFAVIIFHFKIFFSPIIFLGIGIAIRIFFKEKYLLVYIFLFPIVSGFAFFENKGMPLNYLVLPLIFLVGIFIADFFIYKENISHLFDRIDRKSTRLNSSHMSESRMPSSA